MADKVTQERTLSLEFGFYDNDTRTVTLDNPKTNLTSAQIKAVGAAAKSTAAIIGDKASAAVVGINSAKITNKKVTVLDLR